MSTHNMISVAIPESIVDECARMANLIAASLKPYLHGLLDEERRDLFKLGDKSVGYLEKQMGYLETAPQFIPEYMDVAEFKKDAQVVAALQPIYQIIAPLLTNIEDTRMLAGSEAMTTGKMYYGNVRLAAKNNIPGARAIYEDLSERFPGRKGGSLEDAKPAK